MAGDASAYTVLGLDPGADPSAVDQAYKRLIKQHHPDRAGGDPVRAAEINRAYRELRRGGVQKDPLEFNEELRARRARRGWPLAALIAVLALGLWLATRAPWFRPEHAVPHAAGAQAAGAPEPMDQPLHQDSLAAAVRDALSIARTKDEMALATASRDCQRRFRDSPSVSLLDRCAAFDDAVVDLQDRDPLRDQGPFSEVAVTGRQWSAASSLSDDDLAIDSRLGRIRLQVELALAPAEPPPQVGNSVSANSVSE